ncbi:MAG: molybdopterin-dependent oxidoreductase [Rectinema sp.]|nr:molybdopterin-dependent oxidoreductase [Rectinema sp.]
MNTLIPESLPNVRGQTQYIDDMARPAGCLQAAVRLSESAHARILAIHTEKACALDPSVRIILAKDIPGTNQIGFNKADEPVLPEDEWDYWGQPIALAVAKTRTLARRAAALLEIESELLPVITDPREAASRGDLIFPPRSIARGDVDAAFAQCAWVAEGRVDSGGQEHVYLETQGAIAEVIDGRRVHVISSTQGPTGVQKAVAQALGIPMNMVEVEARRLGGGFGGKEDQAALWASLAAVAAWICEKPVELYLNRKEDMRATGKRHPYSTDFRIGADAEGKLVAFEAVYYQNSGATCDLSPAILARTLLHATGAYQIPNVKVTGYMCRTNLPSFTAFRGFGAPQAFFVIEAAMDALARKIGIDPIELKYRNLYQEGDETYYGMKLERVRAREAFDHLLSRSKYSARKAQIAQFNAEHRLEKKGLGIIPIAFGISFTKLQMNQAGALVHVYTDGSVVVSTGAIEMGQQVARKIALITARTLGIPASLVTVQRTSTLTVANTVPTAASTGADLNGMAAKIACEEIRGRMIAHAAAQLAADAATVDIQDGIVTVNGEKSTLEWKTLVESMHAARKDLSAHGFYATPFLEYDMKRERGRPFAYHVYGAALVEATIDVLRGTSRIDATYIVHDIGDSIDPAVDRGQIEGALAQGLGWALLEDLRFAADGKPLSDTLSTYKVPDISFMPEDLVIDFLSPAENPTTPYNSKAVGEPPLQYGIAGYFAVLEAIRAAGGDNGTRYSLPLIPEKIADLLAAPHRQGD